MQQGACGEKRKSPYVDLCPLVLSHFTRPDSVLNEQSDVSSSSQARQKLEGLLNKNMRIRMTDGRTLVGLFLCTDRDCNVILGSAQEFLKSTDTFSQGEPRVLGLAMIPGHHVVSIEVEADSLEDTQGFGANH
ncbi:N-alpha-acetyltransferase 38, NatC auxiliary subunit isoform X1 [Thunnus albacares]|uniref:N-alpha-acetyltransferase 38, NatC auxiliary subunit isoform X1 n=1 Tax=Thunnus albacares TaxID=8236 RepID=UPI001CF64372|nr:N-alpha-acetyltransferase 38, NatC auxiliary subunit isoform X1 [Thunnus albacares]